MKNKIYSFTLMMVIILSSCTEDFLDRSPNDQIASSEFFTLKKDLIYAVNGCYYSLGYPDWADGGRTSSTYLFAKESITDNGYDGHSWNEGYSLAVGTATPSDYYVTGYWKERYRGIQRANRIIEGAPNVQDISDDLRERLVAEVKFLRAYWYWELTYLYGDVPFYTKSITPGETSAVNGEAQVERTDKNIILDALVQDLTEAADALPESYGTEDLGRATKGAALTLKARILLGQDKWAEAAIASAEVMDLSYSLYPSYANLFTYASINSEEVIFDLQEMPKEQWNFVTLNLGPNSLSGWSSGTPLQSLVDAYECTDGQTIDVSPLYDPTSPYEDRDPRLHHSILYPGREWDPGANFGGTGVYNSIPGASFPGKDIVPGDDLTDGTGGQWNKTFTGYNWLKYIQLEDQETYEGWMMAGSCHLILMRYAEVLLMYAEAKIEANDIDQSVYDAINLVRGRDDVNMPPVATGKTQSELRETIRRERRVELALEGLRLWDIRRWRIAEDVMPGVPNLLTYPLGDPNGTPIKELENRVFDPAKHYLWPIPEEEVNVSKISQNPGW